MIIHDESGWRWLIAPGDPAADIVGTLGRAGLRAIRLPRRTIIGGKTEDPPSVEVLEAALAAVDQDPSLIPMFLDLFTLYDCCVVASRTVR